LGLGLGFGFGFGLGFGSDGVSPTAKVACGEKATMVKPTAAASSQLGMPRFHMRSISPPN
jgi:hypothetical protein